MIRLINVHTAQFSTFDDRTVPPYAIASHRWTDDETTYKDFSKGRCSNSKGHRKVVDFCAFVDSMNPKSSSLWTHLFNPPCDWLWIDTVCIDKRDLSELSESLNSMYKWYRDAQVCYAQLSDVSFQSGSADRLMQFMQSEWFTRGWTLQELLAPSSVIFITSDWKVIGHKCHQGLVCTCTDRGANLAYLVSCISGIQIDALSNFHAQRSSIPAWQKLAWMARRTTTKPEDRVYCMLGLFDVHLVPCYSEGENNAWLRLGREITNGPASRDPCPGTNWWIAQYTGTNPLANRPSRVEQAYYSTMGNMQPSMASDFPADARLADRPFRSTVDNMRNVGPWVSQPATSGSHAKTCARVLRQATLGRRNGQSLRGFAHNIRRLYSKNTFGLYDCGASGCCWTNGHGFESLNALFRHMQSVHHDG